MRILIYTGKGGVGKTCIAAMTALRLAGAGRRVLIMSTDQAHSLSDAFGLPIGREVRSVCPGLDALELDPALESRKAWGQLQDYLRQILVDRANGGLAADEALLFPGMEELFSLLRILDVWDEGNYDTLLVDCAPTGETLALLRYPERLNVLAERLLPGVRSMTKAFGGLISQKTTVPKPRDAVFAEFEVLVKRLDRLQKILRDRAQCSLRIVMTPERIVVEEARRAYTWLQGYDFGVDAVFVNRVYPDEAMRGAFAPWLRIQEENLALARESFAGQRLFTLEMQPQELSGLEALAEAAEKLYGDELPDAVYLQESAMRMEDEQGTRILIIRLPYADEREIEVRQEGTELLLKLRNELRRFPLPDKVSRRRMSGWSYEDGELRIRMDYD